MEIVQSCLDKKCVSCSIVEFVHVVCEVQDSVLCVTMFCTFFPAVAMCSFFLAPLAHAADHDCVDNDHSTKVLAMLEMQYSGGLSSYSSFA